MTKSYTRYAGKVVQVSARPFVFPDGSSAEMEVVHLPGAAAVVAINGAKEVCLLRQYRHVFGARVWELPAGKRDGGEAPLRCAPAATRVCDLSAGTVEGRGGTVAVQRENPSVSAC